MIFKNNKWFDISKFLKQLNRKKAETLMFSAQKTDLIFLFWLFYSLRLKKKTTLRPTLPEQ